VDPGFVGAGDFSLASDSPLIDNGDPAGLADGESATDLAGNNRLVRMTASNGCVILPARRDIGAYETQGPTPVGSSPAPGSCGPPPTPLPPAVAPPQSKCKKNKGKHRAAAAKKKCKKKKGHKK
jgi:hypothetical protein